MIWLMAGMGVPSLGLKLRNRHNEICRRVSVNPSGTTIEKEIPKLEALRRRAPEHPKQL
jgi:hypothetical protein